MAESVYDRGRKKLTKRKSTANNDDNSDTDNVIETEIENVNIKSYGLYDKGPFFVHIEKKKADMIKTTIELKKSNITEILEIKKIGRETLKVQTKDKKTANKIIDWSKNKDDIKAYVPDHYIKTVGIVYGITNDIDIKEIKNHTTCERGYEKIYIEDMERLTKWNKESQTTETTNNIKITFRSQKLPENISIFYSKFNVNLFQRKPLQCMNCLKYGHSKKKCTSKKVCANCLD